MGSFKKWANKQLNTVKRNVNTVIKDPFNIELHAKQEFDKWGKAFGVNDLMGLEAKEKRRQREAELAAAMQSKQSLLKALAEPTSEIDTQSKAEITSLLQTNSVSKAKSLYNKAFQATDMKFKSRRATDEMTKTLLDMPGMQQTRAEAFNNAFIRNR